MDENEPTETISGENVTVYQMFTEERFEVPTVALKFVSDWEVPVRVRLVVRLLPSLAVQEIGFHQEYRSEDWSVDGERLVFETELEPDEEMTTMYAVESISADQVDDLFDATYVETVTPLETAALTTQVESGTVAEEPGPGDDDTAAADDTGRGIEGSASEAGEDESAGDDVEGTTGEPESHAAEQSPEIEPTPDEDGPDAGPDEAAPDAGPDEAVADAGPDEAAPDAGPDEAVPDAGPDEAVPDAGSSDDESIVDAIVDGEKGDERGTEATDGREELSAYSTGDLVDEIEARLASDALSEGDRERLRSHLVEDADGATASLETRVGHLQQRVSDAEAYADEMEEFHDRYGTPVDAFGALEDRLATLSDRVESVDDRVESVDEVEPRLRAIEGDVERMGNELTDVEDTVESVEDDVRSVEAEQEDLREEISTLKEWKDRVTDTLGALGGG